MATVANSSPLPVIDPNYPQDLRALLAEHQVAAAREVAQVMAIPPERLRLIDTETSSLEGVPVEIHITDGLGRPLLTDSDGRPLRDGLRINPGVKQDPKSVAVHGITDEMLKGAPSFAAVAGKIQAAMCEADAYLAYNAPFDRLALARAWRLARPGQLPEFLAEDTWFCAMKAWARFQASWSLERGQHRNLRLNGPHTAGGDVAKMLGLLRTMAAAHRPTDAKAVSAALSARIRRVAPAAHVVRIQCYGSPSSGVPWAGAYASVYDQRFSPVLLAGYQEAYRLGHWIAEAFPDAPWPARHDYHVRTGRLGRTPGPGEQGFSPAEDGCFGTNFGQQPQQQARSSGVPPRHP